MNFVTELQAPQPYSLAWEVNDAPTYNNYAHSETCDGKEVTGSYRFALPDGRTQIVTYKADSYGYVADVKYEGMKGNTKPSTPNTSRRRSTKPTPPQPTPHRPTKLLPTLPQFISPPPTPLQLLLLPHTQLELNTKYFNTVVHSVSYFASNICLLQNK